MTGPTLADVAQTAARPCGASCSLNDRRGRLATPGHHQIGVPETDHGPWYATEAGFQLMLEAGLAGDPEHAGKVTSSVVSVPAVGAPRVLVYTHSGVDVPSQPSLVPVRIEFHEYPPYRVFGLPAHDYPRVFADPGADSPHRQPDDDALCLWQPLDPADRRWVAAHGLGQLLSIVKNHLFFEVHWRATGTWLGDEAPHGFADEALAPKSAPKAKAAKGRSGRSRR